MRNTIFYFLIISFFFCIISCSDDEMTNGDGCPAPTETYETGVFVINEGQFQNGTGTLSFFNENTQEVADFIYQQANCDEIIGNILQSVTFVDEQLFFVVNNANKVIITDEKLDKIGEVTGLDSPRFFLKINENKAYITQWTTDNSAGNVAVINLQDYSIQKTIPTKTGPEYIVEYQGKIYVSNSGGLDEGFDNNNATDFGDSTITIINPITDEEEKTLVVGNNPNSFQIDKNGDLWVSCLGYLPNYLAFDPNNISGKLVRINNEEVQEIIDLEKIGAQKMSINPTGDVLYFLQDDTNFNPVYTFHIDTKIVSPFPLIDVEAYGLGVHPISGHIFVGDARNFVETGEVSEYDENGNFIQSFFTSIGPNGFIFK